MKQTKNYLLEIKVHHRHLQTIGMSKIKQKPVHDEVDTHKTNKQTNKQTSPRVFRSWLPNQGGVGSGRTLHNVHL